MAISGLLLIGYLITHLIANLMTLLPDGGRTLNLYSYTLHKLGPLLTLARIVLAILFISHIISGIRVILENRRGRTSRYAVTASKGGPSKLSAASLWMAKTGIVLMIYVPVHVWMFTLGPYYETVIDGVVMRDLYRLTVEQFNNPVVAFSYSAVMLLLWLHLRHGFWSALQTLGAMRPRWSPVIYSFGYLFAILLAGGFLLLPLYVYFFIPVPEAAAMGVTLR